MTILSDTFTVSLFGLNTPIDLPFSVTSIITFPRMVEGVDACR